MEKEIWKDIPDYEGYYQVSNYGNVKSLDRIVEHKRAPLTLKGQILYKRLGGKGNRYYSVSLTKNGKGKIFTIHKLVAIVFLNHTPSKDKTVVDHIDNNSLNNRLDNLQLISQRENSSKDKNGYTSKYVGVYYEKPRNKWVAQITIGDKRTYLGRYDNEEDAHKRYQKALNEISIHNSIR